MNMIFTQAYIYLFDMYISKLATVNILINVLIPNDFNAIVPCTGLKFPPSCRKYFITVFFLETNFLVHWINIFDKGFRKLDQL